MDMDIMKMFKTNALMGKIGDNLTMIMYCIYLAAQEEKTKNVSRDFKDFCRHSREVHMRGQAIWHSRRLEHAGGKLPNNGKKENT